MKSKYFASINGDAERRDRQLRIAARERFCTTADAGEVLRARQTLVTDEIREERLDVATEAGHLTCCHKGEHGRAAIKALVQTPRRAGYCHGGNRSRLAVGTVCRGYIRDGQSARMFAILRG